MRPKPGPAARAAQHMIVTITKVAAAPDALHAPAAWAEINPGLSTLNEKSLPVDYEIQGELTAPILPGQPLRALRYRRNGVPALGAFHSSEVREIHVLTHNSVYRITAAGG